MVAVRGRKPEFFVTVKSLVTMAACFPVAPRNGHACGRLCAKRESPMQYAIVREGHSYIIVVEGQPLLRCASWRRAARTIAELRNPVRVPEALKRRPAPTKEAVNRHAMS